jgi:L-amino acid N-acyltransferase YncA
MRNELVLALAPLIGQTLTPEAAKAIVDRFEAEGRAIDVAAIAPKQCGSLTFQAERLLDIIPEMELLHQLHWQETEGYRHGLGLDMDYATLVLEEQAGTMIQFTARAEGHLVGNYRLYLRRDRHTQTLFAQEDTWYLMPEYRRGRNALRFLEYPREVLNAMGYHQFQADVADDNPAASRLLEHRGFKRVPKTKYILIEENGHVL